ncbi:MAG: sigma 54-interacting transcriptional regulator [Deltaproteobacteria bacterium]|nr:sigma 54-interacting transcriptional regulator [Deltaproteobacteria bacterium]
MKNTNVVLTDNQWQFLAVLEAFGGPVSADTAGALAPLLPGPLFDLIEKGRSAGWLRQDKNNCFSLSADLPDDIRDHLIALNGKSSLNDMVDNLYLKQMHENVGPEEMLTLLTRTGRRREAAEYEIGLAHAAFNNNDFETSRVYLQAAVEHLYPIRAQDVANRMFVSSVLELSNMLFSLGYGFGEIVTYLNSAGEVTQKMGDQRSHALLNLHLGRLYYFSNRRDEAIVALSMGFEEIHELGDDDILGQSALFLGLLYFTKGLHKKAIEHFEKAEQAFGTAKWGVLTHPTAPFLTGYCAVYLGQFHRAIGNLDYQWRLAKDRSDTALASTIQATLGTVLILLRKQKEGLNNLEEALEEALGCGNALGVHLARGGFTLHHFLEGRMEKACRASNSAVKKSTQAGIIRQYASPWILEMNYEFHRLGFQIADKIHFPDEMHRILTGVNVHLKGVAFRLKAHEKSSNNEHIDGIRDDLVQSMHYLEQSGDPVQLSKTILEMARTELRCGDREKARQLARKARHLLGGYTEEFFPDEFRHLFENQESPLDPDHRRRQTMQSYLEMIESLYPIETRQEILAGVLSRANRLFGAERSALFWFPGGKYTAVPKLRATCNLPAAEIEHESFKTNLAMVLKAFHTNQPQLGRSPEGDRQKGYPRVFSMLSIPVEVGGSVHGVMYFDNSYLSDAFDFLDPEIMRDIARHTNLVVERRLHHLRIEEERNLLVSMKSHDDARDSRQIVAKSEKMKHLLKVTDQIAGTDSTILITGETGTGKELLAYRIHRSSQRSEKPFIVVDATTIPENLLESELFGHERGAFTGADRRRLGRIEMAHEGTLFLDEIGELPLPAQVKLLRAIQEKEFNRLGGTRTIRSNFRLIAATNRDLEKEIAESRFREDLYYRLNVIPIHLPPLRERQEDIALLADHFIDRYTKKYNRHDLKLTGEQVTILRTYKWPGNVRELQNIIERAVLLSTDKQLEFSLPVDMRGQSTNPFEDFPTLGNLQRRYIEFVIKKTKGQIGGTGGAAEILGMNRTSVYSRMRQLRMDVKSLKRQSLHVEK